MAADVSHTYRISHAFYRKRGSWFCYLLSVLAVQMTRELLGTAVNELKIKLIPASDNELINTQHFLLIR